MLRRHKDDDLRQEALASIAALSSNQYQLREEKNKTQQMSTTEEVAMANETPQKCIVINPTVINGGGVKVVPIGKADKLSIYIDDGMGGMEWQRDHNRSDLGSALEFCAKLSMFHGIPIRMLSDIEKSITSAIAKSLEVNS